MAKVEITIDALNPKVGLQVEKQGLRDPVLSAPDGNRERLKQLQDLLVGTGDWSNRDKIVLIAWSNEKQRWYAWTE
jgi:hypothetical protein